MDTLFARLNQDIQDIKHVLQRRRLARRNWMERMMLNTTDSEAQSDATTEAALVDRVQPTPHNVSYH